MRSKDISFTVRAGEIFGIAGVAGNGQNACWRSQRRDPGGASAAIRLDGAALGALGSTERRRRGLCAVPEERNGHAAVADFTLADNSVLTARDRLGMVARLISAGARPRLRRQGHRRLRVKATGPAATAGSLSGGNLQKYIMGREILQVPEVLVVSQPTWGSMPAPPRRSTRRWSISPPAGRRSW